MELVNTVSTHLPKAVVAAFVIALFDIYTEDVTTLLPLIADFIVYVVAIVVGFIVIDALWNTVRDKSGM